MTMEIDTVRTMARELMTIHGLNDWRLRFINIFSACGRCNYREEVIEINQRWIAVASEEEIRNTILHEIAHAMLGPGYGHGVAWRNTFISIGGNGERCANAAEIHKQKRFIIQCTAGCENLGYRQRRDPRLLNNKVCRLHRASLLYIENS